MQYRDLSGKTGRRFPRSRLVIGAAVAALVGAGVGAGSVLMAGAATPSVTYYACLKNGTLSLVSTTQPTCPKGASPISWNSQGPAGVSGNTILNGSGGPSESTGGVNGDFYLDTTAKVLYGPKVNGAWPATGTSLIGPQGEQGIQGAPGSQGAQGNTILNGSGAPSDTLGVDGDFYLDTGAHVLYGPKADGAWPATGISVIGSVTTEPMTIYSDTLTPYAQFADPDALEDVRYPYGPWGPPHLLAYVSGSGHFAFFNTPDLTIGSTPMSAVSARVCVELTKPDDPTGDDSRLNIMFGVQDKDQHAILADMWDVYDTTNGQVCQTLTLDPPVALTNYPHMVTVIEPRLRSTEDTAVLDGITYTLRPTEPGDTDLTELPALAHPQPLLGNGGFSFDKLPG